MQKLEVINSRKKALVDDSLYDECVDYIWKVAFQAYDSSKERCIYTNQIGDRIFAHLHWFVMTHFIEIPSKIHIDHINNNIFDNRFENLRLATNQQNQANSVKQKNRSSSFKGVSWVSAPYYKRRWEAGIQYNGEMIHIGYFDSEEEAAMRYDLVAIDLFGNFANTNFEYGPDGNPV